MPLYIRDEEVAELARRTKEATGAKTVTEAVKRALERELADRKEQTDSDFVERALAFGRRMRAKGDPSKGLPADKAFIDSLYEDD